ncbi:hypothetical protein PRIPAC_90399 [Pristionchus pacificus]|uniref:Uncharacterized protein n=1 Tax=Pristionchus pacificus TaxID=54126 RepID=A0A2A6B5P1_PRIPA|nr:hypothetical protein PRIPAC_90399 [Pristionchus pacificus]|eukprot:PDM61187.1 hypothetical protein PRIPAC_50629 [Pristionchus pacificus]
MYALPIFFFFIIPITDTLECHSQFNYNDRTYKDTQGCLETPLFINCCCSTNLCNNDTLVPPLDPEPDAASSIDLFSMAAVATMIAIMI